MKLLLSALPVLIPLILLFATLFVDMTVDDPRKRK
jgi:hypothetical protein